MAQLGTVKDGREIGYSRGKYKWCACTICGHERWVRLEHGNPRNQWCRHCGQKISHPLYRGGHKIRKANGYVYEGVYPTDFFFKMADVSGYVAEHRLVMAKHLRRNLHLWETVHHKNGVRDDNRIENLELLGNDRHNQITRLSTRIKYLEQRVNLLEGELRNAIT